MKDRKRRLLRKKSYNFSDLAKIVSILRSPQGCPWDRKQKLSAYRHYLQEEVYELIEALRQRREEEIKEELGDVMLLLLMVAQMHKEKGKFGIDEVIDGICRKLIRRHPHVFGRRRLKSAEAVIRNWARQKAAEKKRDTYAERIPASAPALLRSTILFKEEKHLGKRPGSRKPKVPLPEDGKKLSARLLGKYLLFLSWLAFKSGIDPEEALAVQVMRQARRLKYGRSGKKKK